MLQRLDVRRVAGDAGRYLAVGLLATVVAVLLFNLLVHGFSPGSDAPLNRHPELAYVLANGVGMLISYRGTRSWAFRDRAPVHPDGGRTAFVAINLVTLLIPLTCLWASRNLLGLDDPLSDNVSANVVGLALANAARFLAFRQWVFPRSDVDPAPLVVPGPAPAPGGGSAAPVVGEELRHHP